jgi:predicted HTH transcriptional regulator
MNVQELLDQIKTGEDSKTQFKEAFTSPDALAAEITAFANSLGGKILVGVTDQGLIEGLSGEEVTGLNQMISNVCFHKIDPNISVTTENVACENGVVVVINVPMGPNKFYLANGKDVWVKVGADKRRAKREEMQRLLQESGKLYADEQVIENSGLKDLDLLLINEFIEKRLEEKADDVEPSLESILGSMKVLAGGKCTLAGLLLFTKKKHLALSHYGIGAVSWYGNDLSGTDYRDSEDIQGNVVKLFADGMGFLKRQLRKLQNGQGFNSLGILEIPDIALEEALVNAIVHRNYFIHSNIRLQVFDNRVEIISPGVLPNTLSVESIKTGVHVVRNPILLSHIKDIPGIPYRGMGTGVSRIIKSCKGAGVPVEFHNDPETEQFTVIFGRKEI